jgi:hypothetical protein
MYCTLIPFRYCHFYFNRNKIEIQHYKRAEGNGLKRAEFAKEEKNLMFLNS